ncbi:alpha-L-rhamnosidase [Mariniphaga anaerophila]|uniref:Alpha-L-rhamnosidase n=1 Tax=Mariniphaga anaerophila TaxID=1484053 RepID=A0A1M5FSN4_9BACT|nr:glycosyl hydrolase [Mariniphaga anaerophila]SHF94557.1 alpha-L-rhamnosidase [Mariniphaga anaerophila]
MKIPFQLLIIMSIITACSVDTVNIPQDGRFVDYSSMIEEFRSPGADYRSAPFWVWNHDVSQDDINYSLTEFKKNGIDGVFLHPRYGMITEYLSDNWFELVDYTKERARELDMRVWIYDENSYPSGFAGGHVPEQMPESYNQGIDLVPHRMEKLDLHGDYERIKYVFKNSNGEWQNITSSMAQEDGQLGDYVILELKNSSWGSKWYAGFSYVDLLVKGVTEKFMDITMAGYEKYLGDEFAKTVPGIFTDEPNIATTHRNAIRWTPDLFEEFKKKWGYDLEPYLISLIYETGEWKKIRHNYQYVLLDMFIERWSKPWYNYTEDKNLAWTGHYWEHGWPSPHHGPDNMAMYAWHQVPAIDMLFNTTELRPDQFGNNVAVKELSSVANQFDRHRALSETYGGAGWELRFEDMKRLGDWEYTLGVNFLNQHLSHMSLAGDRKHDYPQSFMPYVSYWKLYKKQADYFARLSVALSSGIQENKILLLEPTTTAWMYYSPYQGMTNDRFNTLKESFSNLVDFIEFQQVEYDLGCENIIRDNGSVEGNSFVVNKRSYDVVIIPDVMDNFDSRTMDLLEQYAKNGGVVVQIGESEKFVNGISTDRVAAATQQDSWNVVPIMNKSVVGKFLSNASISIESSKRGEMYHHRRKLIDGEILFFSNFSLEESANTIVKVEGKSVEGMCPQTGETFPIAYKRDKKNLIFNVELDPAGSYMVYVHKKQTIPPKEEIPILQVTKLPASLSSVEALSPNILTVDFVTLKIGEGKEENMFFAKASERVYKHYGFEDGNPWFASSQFKTEILDRQSEYKEGDGFEVSYAFLIDKDVDTSNSRLVIERSNLYNITLNGKEIEAKPGDFWLDRELHFIEAADFLKEGENRLKLTVDKFNVLCEIEPVYLLGNFSLESFNAGWKVVPAKPLKIGSWIDQGAPFYGRDVRYKKEIETNKQGVFEVRLPLWNGTVAEVIVNGKSFGIIQTQPYSKNVNLQKGMNEISVIVHGSLKNTFGPHHGITRKGIVTPWDFKRGAERQPKGVEYDFLEYGLIEDFVVSRVDES